MTTNQGDNWLERLRADHPAWNVRMSHDAAYLCEFRLPDGYIVISSPNPVAMGFRMTELQQCITAPVMPLPQRVPMRGIDQ